MDHFLFDNKGTITRRTPIHFSNGWESSGKIISTNSLGFVDTSFYDFSGFISESAIGIVDSVNTIFRTSIPFVKQTLFVFVNGVEQSDFIVSGNSVIFNQAPIMDLVGGDDEVNFKYYPDPSFDLTPPVFSGAIGASGYSNTEIRVNWFPGGDNITSLLSLRYLIYYSDIEVTYSGLVSNGSLMEVTGTSFAIISSLISNTTYNFVVKCKDLIGNVDNNTVIVSSQTL